MTNGFLALHPTLWAIEMIYDPWRTPHSTSPVSRRCKFTPMVAYVHPNQTRSGGKHLSWSIVMNRFPNDLTWIFRDIPSLSMTAMRHQWIWPKAWLSSIKLWGVLFSSPKLSLTDGKKRYDLPSVFMAFDVFATCLGGMGIQFIWAKSAHLRDVSVGKNVDAPKFNIKQKLLQAINIPKNNMKWAKCR